MDSLLAHLLDAAARAPSAHNTQPWGLRWRGDVLEVFRRQERALPAVDPSGADLLHALGALLENVVLTLEQLGFEAAYDLPEGLDGSGPVAVVRWRSAETSRPDPTLYRMIPVRQTSRLPYRAGPIPAEDLEAVRRSVGAPATLSILTAPEEIEAIRRLVSEATAEQLADRSTAEELYSWLRFSKRDRRWYRDGLNAECMGWSRPEAIALSGMLAPVVLRRLGRWGLFKLLGSDVEKNAPAAPALGLLTLEGDDVPRRIEAGRRLQRAWLTAASRGLSTHPISAAVDVERTRPVVLGHFGLPPGTVHVNLFRIGRSEPPARSPRLPVDEMLLATS